MHMDAMTGAGTHPGYAGIAGALAVLAACPLACGGKAEADVAAAAIVDQGAVLPRPVRAACDTVRSQLDTLTGEQAGFVRDTLLAGPGSLPATWPRRGCLLRLDRDSGSASKLVDALRERLGGAGWNEALRYGADGPDGTAFASWRGEVLCHVSANWDGGNDADPTYVPRSGFELRVMCTRREPADTASG
jgi:hypothetical protein